MGAGMSAALSRRAALLAAAAATAFTVPAVASDDASALALHAEYRAACEAVARWEAGLLDDPEGECNVRRWALEQRIMATPGVSLQMLAVKLMAASAAVRWSDFGKPDEQTDDGFLSFRDVRDEVAAAAGLDVIDPEAMSAARAAKQGRAWA